MGFVLQEISTLEYIPGLWSSSFRALSIGIPGNLKFGRAMPDRAGQDKIVFFQAGPFGAKGLSFLPLQGCFPACRRAQLQDLFSAAMGIFTE
jgi:hypothetical protein